MCHARTTHRTQATRFSLKPQASRLKPRRGFTLVEMLVVIVIILILVGLLTPVIGAALAHGKEAAIQAEIGNLDSAIKAYKERYGAYPPSDMATPAVVAQHLQRIFPRCNVTLELQAVVALSPNSTTPMSPAQALVFWLSGFSNDPEHPITGRLSLNLSNNTFQIPNGFNWALNAPAPLMNFSQDRLIINTATNGTGPYVPVYVPSNVLTAPFVYFSSPNYLTYWNKNPAPIISSFQFPGTVWAAQGGQGGVLPYLQDSGNLANLFPNAASTGVVPFANPSSFQIISAGLDDDYGGSAAGVGATYPSGVGTGSISVTINGVSNTYTYNPYLGDKDNLTNFSGSKTC